MEFDLAMIMKNKEGQHSNPGNPINFPALELSGIQVSGFIYFYRGVAFIFVSGGVPEAHQN